MARRGRRKGRGRKSRSLPIIQTAVLAYPVVNRFKSTGMSAASLRDSVWDLSGFNVQTGRWENPEKGIAMAVALVALSTIGSKLASRSGANRLVKKVTGNYLKLA